MARIERIISKSDGSEVKIVARESFDINRNRSFDVYALKRSSPEAPWQGISDRPAPDWRTMSVEEYKTSGRSELLQVVGQAQILKTISLLGDSSRHAQIDEECDQFERPRARM